MSLEDESYLSEVRVGDSELLGQTPNQGKTNKKYLRIIHDRKETNTQTCGMGS